MEWLEIAMDPIVFFGELAQWFGLVTYLWYPLHCIMATLAMKLHAWMDDKQDLVTRVKRACVMVKVGLGL